MIEVLLVAAAAAPQVVTINAMRFRFEPENVTVKADQPIVFRIKSLDRVHGFNIPDLHVRTNVVPDKVTEVKVPAQKPGKHAFFCDVFCGEGHDEMGGTITVKE
jgi:cytochrome c oxidase subunit 2